MSAVNKDKAKEKIFYVYLYIDPRNNSPFYVGKGKNKRVYAHLCSAKNKKNKTYLANKIRKIQREIGQDPEIILFKTGLSEDEAFSIEIELIKRWGRRDIKTGCLANMADGGEGTVNLSEETRRKIGDKHRGKVVSEESKEKNRQAHLGKPGPWKGKHRDEETRLKLETMQFKKGIVPWNKGKKMTEEYCRKNSESHKGLVQSEVTLMRRKETQQRKFYLKNIIDKSDIIGE